MLRHPVRRAAAPVLLVIAGLLACKEEPFVPTATTITVSPSSRAFHAINATQQLSATVLDQRGNAMSSAGLSWSTNSPGVAEVDATGLVTARGTGSAMITAAIGSASGQASVTVSQVPAQIVKFSGDAQSGPASQQLALPLVARVIDSSGVSVPGVAVGFAATSGGGSVGTPSATTNSTGQASTTWTLGSTVGTQQVTATVTGIPAVVFSATGLGGAPDSVSKESADPANVPAGTPASPAPSVRVFDQNQQPVSGVSVLFEVTAGGGFVTGGGTSASHVTNASGIATVGQWVVGASGTQELTATVSGSGITGNPVTFTATVLAPGAPATVVIDTGNGQTGLQGYPVNVRPTVLVRDASNNPVQGVTVTFSVQTGGGSVSGATPATNLTGQATVGNWTIGSGANSMTATAAGVATPVTFNATGVAPTFNIDVRYLTTVTPAQEAAFDSAAARWSRVIFGDIPPVAVNSAAGACRPEVPAVSETIDDVVIFVILQNIDGNGGILGSAGPCFVRNSPSFLTAWGVMRFDTTDLSFLQANNLLQPVIMHEMAHVLGLGTLWQTKGLLSGAGGSDPFFTGAQARAAFDTIGGTSYSGGGKVPVENTGGPGTRDGHWRKTIFGTELMTGSVAPGSTPISIVTAAQFGDMGYQINLGAADAFTLPGALSVMATQGLSAYLHDDIRQGPIYVIDQTGRIVRVIQ